MVDLSKKDCLFEAPGCQRSWGDDCWVDLPQQGRPFLSKVNHFVPPGGQGSWGDICRASIFVREVGNLSTWGSQLAVDLSKQGRPFWASWRPMLLGRHFCWTTFLRKVDHPKKGRSTILRKEGRPF